MKVVITFLVAIVLLLTALLLFRASSEPEKVMASQTIHLTANLVDNIELQPLSLGEDRNVDAMKVEDILKFYQADTSGIQSITFIATDGMSMQVMIDELPDLFLTRQQDDNFRLVIPTDEFHQRWLKNIEKIELQ